MGSRTKTRTSVCGKQRGVISDLEKVITTITSWPEVKTVNTCHIQHVASAGKNLVIRVVSQLENGVKCVARKGNQRQTFYVVTGYPQQVANKLKQEIV